MVLVVAFLLLPNVSHALIGMHRKALRGLKGVYVVVECAKGTELKSDQLQTEVKLRLRKAGVGVLTEKEEIKTHGGAMLMVLVTAFDPDFLPGICIYSVTMQLIEDVTISWTFPFWGIIWSESATGYGGIDNKNRYIWDGVSYLIDKFINDYLAENPK